MAGLDPTSRRWIRIRLGGATALFLTAFVVVLGKAAYLQLEKGDELGELARDQYLKELELTPLRGDILDARGVPLAVSVSTQSVVLDAKTAHKPPQNGRDLPPVDEAGIAKLARAIKVELAQVSRRFAQKGAFTYLKRRISPSEAEEVSQLHLKGVSLVPEFKRFYPQKEVAAHVLGTVGVENEGLEGVEKAQDALLKGAPRRVEGLRDVRGHVLIDSTGAESEATAGATMQLTIDSVIQQAAESALAEGASKARAKAGVAVVMDPASGAVLAMANVPTFNPNAPGDEADARRNRVVTDQYEPGSTMKCFLMAAAISEQVIRPDTIIDVTGGVLQIGKKKVRDSHPPSENQETATKVLATSSNVGCARIGMKLGSQRLIHWYKQFGFGERTQLGLPGEARGVLQNPGRMGDIATATTSFGQGLTATPLQMTTALSAIANGGTLMRPYVVSRLTRADGEVLLDRKPEAVRQVMTKEVAATVRDMMKAVVAPGGTGGLAAVPGYTVAGKTGTAQKADPITHGYGDKRFSSFMGFVPADRPRVAIYVALDEPAGDVYGGKIAAPIFRQIAAASLQQLQVPPESAPDPVLAALEKKERKKGGRPSPTRVVEAEGPAFDEGFVDDESALSELSDPGALLMPDLKGLSARAVLRLLGERALEAELEGSGRAVGQKPAAGSLVKAGTRVHVILGSG